MVRGLKFRIWEVKELHYLCRKSKDADNCVVTVADLRICVRICQIQVSSCRGPSDVILSVQQILLTYTYSVLVKSRFVSVLRSRNCFKTCRILTIRDREKRTCLKVNIYFAGVNIVCLLSLSF